MYIFTYTVRNRKNLKEHPILAGHDYMIIELVPRLAYNYLGGPFKGLMVSHNYDPESDPASRYLQIVQVRMSDKAYRSIQHRYVYEYMFISYIYMIAVILLYCARKYRVGNACTHMYIDIFLLHIYGYIIIHVYAYICIGSGLIWAARRPSSGSFWVSNMSGVMGEVQLCSIVYIWP